MAASGRLHVLLLSLLLLGAARFAFAGVSDGGRLRAPGGASSVLGALLDSDYHYTVELLEKAGMLQPLESVISDAPLTILAVKEEAFSRTGLDARFKRWLLEPANIHQLQTLLQHHVVKGDVSAADWREEGTVSALSEDRVPVSRAGARLLYERVEVEEADAIVREDGRVHGLRELVVPRSVKAAFALWRRQGPLPPPGHLTPAPGFLPFPPSPFGLAPAPAPGPGGHLHLPPAYAWAPAPGPAGGLFLGTVEEEVVGFVAAVAAYGGYSEVADVVANLTSLEADLTLLVESGHTFTFLAPTNEALDQLTHAQLTGAGGLDAILWYHVIPEYLTEEDIYNAVRRNGKTAYATLRQPYTLVAEEADGTVEFGQGKHTARIYDHDLYSDGRISVIGITDVLFPPGTVDPPAPSKRRKLVRREDAEPDFSVLALPSAGFSRMVDGVAVCLVAAAAALSCLVALF